jgi:hypothetical protein
MLQAKTFLHWLKNFFPFLGLSTLYFLLVLLIVFLFNYCGLNSLAWVQKLNPFYLLIRWDSLHYLDVVLKGYDGPSVLFPLYPLIVSGFSMFFSIIFSGFFVSFLSLSTALYYLNKLIKKENGQEIADRSLLLMLFFPTAMFFSLIYTESLFLALLVAFFYYAQKKQWLKVAIIGFFATLTRNVGIFLWPVYLVYTFTFFYPANYKELGKQIINFIKKKECWYSLIIPAGLFLYCLYSYFQFGDFFAFVSGQKGWDEWRTFMWPGATLYHFYKIIFIDPISQTSFYNFFRMVIVEGGSFLILFIATIYWIIKKHWPYAVFCLLNTLLFCCMYPMTAVNRYVVVIFPIFIFLATATKKNNWLFYSILALFFVFFVFNVYLFSVGDWVG